MRLKNNNDGFTLIEVMIVIIIIAILASLVVPKVFNAMVTNSQTSSQILTEKGAIEK